MSSTKDTDTIAAISTGLIEGGIGIIRVSGEDAVEICDKIYEGRQRLSDVASHTISYGHIYDGEDLVDEVMVSVMRAPHSYTKEDVVEINCHGGIFLTRRVLSVVLKNGARPAEPGEFTKRAFLNGRIDLSQAQSVMDLISSENEFSAKNALRQLDGGLRDEIKDLRERLIYEIAYIESALDDPEHISLEGYPARLSGIVSSVLEEVKRLLATADEGALMKNGIRTVIVGKPNVGKSSLLNVLAKKERAIVTDIPGTTRDILEERISLGEVVLNIIDTAGIRTTSDKVEQIGVDRALSTLLDADLVLYVIDASVPLTMEDDLIMEKVTDLPTIVLLNKSDLPSVVSVEEIQSRFCGKAVLSISATEKEGLSELKNEIIQMFFHGDISAKNEIYITNERQKYALSNAAASLRQVLSSIEQQMPEDFFSIDLQDAYEALGRIIGEAVEEDVINEIFAKFCMGK